MTPNVYILFFFNLDQINWTTALTETLLLLQGKIHYLNYQTESSNLYVQWKSKLSLFLVFSEKFIFSRKKKDWIESVLQWSSAGLLANWQLAGKNPEPAAVFKRTWLREKAHNPLTERTFSWTCYHNPLNHPSLCLTSPKCQTGRSLRAALTR